MPCNHLGKVRFLACSAADRYPGVFVCDGCDQRFAFDPTKKYPIQYLPHPNPAIAWKELELKPSKA